jgi:hypothetical protein
MLSSASRRANVRSIVASPVAEQREKLAGYRRRDGERPLTPALFPSMKPTGRGDEGAGQRDRKLTPGMKAPASETGSSCASP